MSPNEHFVFRSLQFAKECEDEELHGLHFQHVALCHRRAWLHIQRIDYSHTDERMKNGSALHDTHRVRDGSVDGLFGLSPDRIDWKERIVYEAKGSDGAKTAVSAQTAFYAVMLTAISGTIWRAKTDLIKQRRHRDVLINTAMLDDLCLALGVLKKIKRMRSAPTAKKIRLCEKCSYKGLCWGDTNR